MVQTTHAKNLSTDLSGTCDGYMFNYYIHIHSCSMCFGLLENNVIYLSRTVHSFLASPTYGCELLLFFFFLVGKRNFSSRSPWGILTIYVHEWLAGLVRGGCMDWPPSSFTTFFFFFSFLCTFYLSLPISYLFPFPYLY